MKKWSVLFLVDASVSVEVEAETKQEARELASSVVESPSICHYCSNHIDVGDIMEIAEITEIT